MGILPLVFRVLLACVFVIAGAGKLFDLAGSKRAMEEFGVPARAARIAGVLLPLVELAVAGALLVNSGARYGGIAAVILLLSFIAGLSRALAQGRAPECHCFGQIHSEPAGPATVARNVILSAIAVPVALAGSGGGLPSKVGELSKTEIELAVAVLTSVVLALATVQLWGERRRLRVELNSALAAARRAGLPRGSQAPDFALMPVRGEASSLTHLLQAERPVVLAFVSTDCEPCLQLLPELARWQDSLTQSVTLATIFSGEHAEVQRLADQHDLKLALAQEANETFEDYELRATPSAVQISTGGRIVSSPAEGHPAIEALLRSILGRAEPPELVIHRA